MNSIDCLQTFLRGLPRRYRLHELQGSTLASIIEQARVTLEQGQQPAAALKAQFTSALATLIEDALHETDGDPAFQAMVLKHQSKDVAEYAALSSQLANDRRRVHGWVNQVAHPAKLARRPAKTSRATQHVEREALQRLHRAAGESAWPAVADIIKGVVNSDAGSHNADAPHVSETESLLRRILESRELARLQRVQALASRPAVRHYQRLVLQQGPRRQTDDAMASGKASKQRGDAVEATAAHAIGMLAAHLNTLEGEGQYRVAMSLRVPAAFPASHDRAKTEWDVVLLKRASMSADVAPSAAPVWDVCLLIEAKVSPESADTDLPRLRRGLQLLSLAEPNATYTFQAKEGKFLLNGATLNQLYRDDGDLPDIVLYCCGTAPGSNGRSLNAASRMQLLSAPASLAYAASVSGSAGTKRSDPHILEKLWASLLQASQWRGVLNQYVARRQARELMVYAQDLLDAANHAAEATITEWSSADAAAEPSVESPAEPSPASPLRASSSES